MNKRSLLPISMQASTIKMDILPRVNFYSNMLPLSPPKGDWDKIHGLISKFIWRGKCPHLKLSMLQRGRQEDGLAVPNFNLYFWSYVRRPVLVWLNPDSLVSWQAIEENLASPRHLQDLVYSNLPPKYSRSKLGPILFFLLSTCQSVENATHTQLIWCTHIPIFHNFSPLTREVPFSSPQWSDKGIHTLSDICNEKGLRTFNDLQISFNLPGFSFFLYYNSDLPCVPMVYHGGNLYTLMIFIFC